MKAFVKYDTDNEQYTIFSEGRGGAVVSGKTIEEAKEKYEEVMALHRVLVNLQMVSRMGSSFSVDSASKDWVKKYEHEYIEI